MSAEHRAILTPGGNVRKSANMPVYSLAAAVLLIVVLAILVAVVPTDKLSSAQVATFIALVVTTIPSLFAAAYAERTSRDVRNGVVVEQARKGATAALEETGVTEVVEASQHGATSVVALQALTALLEHNTRVTEENTAYKSTAVSPDRAPTEVPAPDEMGE